MTTPTQIRELRRRTGAGMLHCKFALEKTRGDVDQAVETLRLEGITNAETRVARQTSEGRIAFGGHTLDLAARTLERNGEVKTLTTGEFSLIKVFAQYPRQPLAREKLMLLARGRDHEVFDRAIDVQVSRLRKLVEPDPAAPRYIQTVWGFGYVYVPEGARASEAAPAENEAVPPADDAATGDAG